MKMMNETMVTVYLILGLVLRCGIPVGITFSLGWLLQKLDAHWKEEVEQADKQVERMLPARFPLITCWEYKGCPAEVTSRCPAYGNAETQCWEHFQDNGTPQPRCQNCLYRVIFAPATMNYIENTGD
ncbi:MAG: hypothetical protein N2C13_05625 [Chloroflexota bacterium]